MWLLAATKLPDREAAAVDVSQPQQKNNTTCTPLAATEEPTTIDWMRTSISTNNSYQTISNTATQRATTTTIGNGFCNAERRPDLH